LLFNSYIFVLAFLPAVLLGFALIRSYGIGAAIGWLVAASLFFYAWWNPAYLLLLGGSIAGNYGIGLLLARISPARRLVRLLLAGAGISANLGLLAQYKYANFFIDSLNGIGVAHWQLEPVMLPLAISFFTFQQIAYLADVYRSEASEPSFLNYCLFVSFFPQLIAGPIVHHREMLPQFMDARRFRLSQENTAVGLTLFTIGLFKKVILADGVAVYANAVFDATAEGLQPSFFEAWGGTLAYTLQLYFDFSGYCDMAVGLARLFGIRLPINFNSPYKAVNIVDFWRRWHITLSRFLRDYLYIPLGGNRHGRRRRYRNLMITMVLGGLWHGAGWTFVLWGGLHGLYLVFNHAWHRVRRRLGHDLSRSTLLGRAAARTLTLGAVMLGWVLFRAADLGTAGRIYAAMFGTAGISLPEELQGSLSAPAPVLTAMLGIRFEGPFPHELAYWPDGIPLMLVMAGIALFTPTAYQWLRFYDPVIPSPYSGTRDLGGGLPAWLAWRPNAGFALVTLAMLLWSLLEMTSVSEFLYFQF
jgi:D-alanyl-lipoteichoic acid acyltransferase DltB (MBOAT superfamily)